MKTYPGEPPVHTLRGVRLTIDQGELAAIAGPPGSGKTTLVHLMATLDRPSPGIARLNGHPCQMNRTGRSPDLWPGRGRGRRAPSRASIRLLPTPGAHLP
jgi:ABC-type lipoprotein export system ATPase subunit